MCGNICKLLFHKGLVSEHRKNSYNSNIKRANSLNKLFFKVKVKWLSHVRLFVTPWTVAYQVPPSMEFSGKRTGVGCHFLLQRIFLTQRSNPGLPHCRQMLYQLSHQGRVLFHTSLYWLSASHLVLCLLLWLGNFHYSIFQITSFFFSIIYSDVHCH